MAHARRAAGDGGDSWTEAHRPRESRKGALPSSLAAMTLWSALVGSFFGLIGAACVVLVVIGLPGTWIMLAIATLLDLLLAPSVGDGAAFFGWKALGICAGVGVVGEILELFLAAEGARRGGASRRGAIGATIGGIIGAILGTIFLWFIPIIGSLIGAVVGAVGGAILGELSRGNVAIRDTAKPATGAAIGRVLGTLSKIPCAVVVWLVLTIAAMLHP